MKVEIKKNEKKYNEVKVTMTLTEGSLLALKHSLERNETSPVAQDLLEFVKTAGEEAGIFLRRSSASAWRSARDRRVRVKK